VLPGVGAFGEAVHRLETQGLKEPLMSHIAHGSPILGICLGMQLLFEWSEESPGAVGLGVFPGTVKRFGSGVKVPHIGWNDVTPKPDDPLFSDIPVGTCFYFVHSFYVSLSEWTIATTEYGIPFSAAVSKDHVAGMQFHPEKSQAAGMRLLENFVRRGVSSR
jgi:imidazole glycerol phosphate synthase glutamine amidotransferase subunit